MSNTVITSSDIQAKYEKLYEFLMKYLWEFAVVQDIANLEIAIFKRFPDKDEMDHALQSLKRDVHQTYSELSKADMPEFQEAVEDLEQTIQDFDNPGCELYSVEEYISDADAIVASNEDTELASSGKQKFEFGEITKTTAEEKALQEEAAKTLENPFEEEV